MLRGTDVTVGSWMLAFNVTHFDDRRLCEPACSATSIAVCVPPARPTSCPEENGADPAEFAVSAVSAAVLLQGVLT